MKNFVLMVALAAMAGCPKPSTSTTLPAGGAPSGEPFASNMGDAPVHPLAGQIVGKPACNERSYMRVDAKGAAFKVTVTVDKGCVMVGGLRDDGGQSAFGIEICADKPDAPNVLEMPAESGRPMITVNETGTCVGATATIALQ